MDQAGVKVGPPAPGGQKNVGRITRVALRENAHGGPARGACRPHALEPSANEVSLPEAT
jgi:hypothetical protein